MTHGFKVFLVIGIASIGMAQGFNGDAPIQAQEIHSQWDEIYASGQAQRGEGLYAENCAACHSWDLTGNEIGSALTGDAFSARWNGRTLAELLDYTQALMPQNSPGGLSRQQTIDVLAYIFRVGGAPSGQIELQERMEEFGNILYLAKAP